MIPRTIGAKLILGFGLIVALTLGLGWYALSQIAEVNERLTTITDRDLKALDVVGRITIERQRMRAARGTSLQVALLDRAKLPHPDPKQAQEAFRQHKDSALALLRDLDAAAAEYERSAVTAQRGIQWGALRRTVGESIEGVEARARAVQAEFEAQGRGDLEMAAALHESGEREGDAVNARISELNDRAQEIVQGGKAAALEAYARARVSVLVVLAVVVVLALASSLFIRGSITAPLGSFVALVERVGEGDLRREANVDGDQELAALGRSLNQMVAGLKRMTGQTRSATEALTAAAAEILASVQEQASSTTEQATAVQQTTATVSQISQAGKQVSERARQVATSAEATSAGSKAGLGAVEELARVMEAIREQADTVAQNVVGLSEKTQAVGEIIATVNDIAEQSHLLALNASIEAASAGEHGRGFSVVASEIKNLADQAKEATVQVRGILGEIQKGINTSVMVTEEAVKRVEVGKQQAQVAEGTIREMAGNIEQSVQTFQQIVAASSQQQIGFDQVAQAIQSISQASQQTAASTRQLEKAAENLNSLGRGLLQAVEGYQT